MPVNPLLAATASPPVPEAQAWRAAYDGAFGPFIDLSQAVPGRPPHADMLKKLAEAAASAEAARYGAITGDRSLRETYAQHVSGLYGGPVMPEEIAVTAGCNQAFFVVMLALAQAGEAVLLPTPWYFNHQMTLAMLGIEARPLPCDQEAGFVPDPEAAEALVDERLRAIVLVTPNNPTGAVYPPDVIARFAELCRRRNLWLVIDETYRDFLPPEAGRPHDLLAGETWRDNVIQLYSFSKAYGIPGHRLGALIAGTPVIAEITKVLDCLQICAPRTGQAALAWAIPALAGWRAANAEDINRRLAAFRAALADLPEWGVTSIGAYFAYLRHPFPGRKGRSVAERLAAERGVLALPGSYFGESADAHVRVAFANVEAEEIARLPERLAAFRL
ncbi:Aspartate/methionine/tyrosine aminotransferase [Chelatococcus sambhunathii]|uniref:Aminotransferase n=1 Tax=Chelatococcus sambhunathii TaxID=363953 RepID=A0ABP2A8P6_9HYPH|nr:MULTISPECIES: aminotransferase [Chelatococcus]CUA87191.1 Aspartate/methionine/tyrosine aminotransferase [Chelatococcus sambhunathii]